MQISVLQEAEPASGNKWELHQILTFWAELAEEQGCVMGRPLF